MLMKGDSAWEYIGMVTGVVLLWVGTFFYIFPSFVWVIPSLIAGIVLLVVGLALVAYETILMIRKKKSSKIIYVGGIIVAVLIALWSIFYLLLIFKPWQ